MAKVQTYLNFNGNAEDAFNFYKTVFGGEFSALMRFREMAGCDAQEVSAEDGEKLMHISLPIGDGNVLMATDALESMGQNLVVGNNSYIYLDAETKDEADRLFAGLAVGGTMEMPIADTFWGAYFGSFADKYGVRWMVSYDPAGKN